MRSDPRLSLGPNERSGPFPSLFLPDCRWRVRVLPPLGKRDLASTPVGIETRLPTERTITSFKRVVCISLLESSSDSGLVTV